MKYLPDTHTFLWTLFDDGNLPDRSKDILADGDNEIYVSVITYWEISLKYSIGKLELEGVRPDDLPKKAGEIDIICLNVSEDEVSSFYNLPKIKHKDPFDRLIIWQAIKRGMTLISKDKLFKDYKKFGLKTLWK